MSTGTLRAPGYRRFGRCFHRRDEAVAAAGNRLDVPWRLGVVPKRGPHLLDGAIEALLDIDEDVGAPEPIWQSRRG